MRMAIRAGYVLRPDFHNGKTAESSYPISNGGLWKQISDIFVRAGLLKTNHDDGAVGDLRMKVRLCTR